MVNKNILNITKKKNAMVEANIVDDTNDVNDCNNWF